MVYLVSGTVTGFEYEALAGVDVLVRNESTEEEATATAGEAGAYSIDLDNAALYPGGRSLGDEVRLRATHGGATRTWRRRVQGTRLVQDVHFTHGTRVGALQKAGLISLDVATSKIGTSVTLRDAHTRDVLAVTKNGTLLATPADYSFSRPATLTLVAALIASDVLEIERTLHRSLAQAGDAIVADGDSVVRNALGRYYPTPLPDRVPELQHLSEVLAASRLRHVLFSGPDKVDAQADGLWKGARALLAELQKGERSLTDADGAYITPVAQASTVPRSSSTPTRRWTRFGDDEVRIQQ